LSQPPTVIVVQRQSPDWSNIDQSYWDGLENFEKLIGWPSGTIRPLIDLWNSTMSVSFFDIRQRMKEISQANLARVQTVTCIDLPRYRAEIDPQALYVFTDDDDWFAPDLAPRLGQIDSKADGIVWRSVRYDGDLEVRPLDGFCYTNNYAVWGRVLARRPELVRIVEQHTSAAEALDLSAVDIRLSITNKHPCSMVRLRKAATGWSDRGSLAAWITEVQEHVRRRPDLVGAGVGWAYPEVNAARAALSGISIAR
jgi:hypothetical protein